MARRRAKGLAALPLPDVRATRHGSPISHHCEGGFARSAREQTIASLDLSVANGGTSILPVRRLSSRSPMKRRLTAHDTMLVKAGGAFGRDSGRLDRRERGGDASMC